MRTPSIKTPQQMLFALAMFASITSQSACGSTAISGTPPSIESPTNTTSTEITADPTVTTPIESAPTATELPPTLPFEEGLNSSGPWLVVRTKMGLFAFNSDGTGMTTLLGRPDIAAPRDLRPAIAPHGGMVAFVYREQGVGHVLHVVSLPSARDQEISVIYPAERSEVALARDQVASAIEMDGSLAWSPDGSTLAYVGAADGPSADVYTLTVADDSIRQLTSGESHAYHLSWSPDSKWILHAGVGSFGTGAGYSMEGVWLANADGSDVLTLYTPTSSDEGFDGWLSTTTFLVHSWLPSCGKNNLRSFDAFAGSEAPIVSGFFNERGLAIDVASQVGVIGVDQYVAQCNTDPTPGTYFFSLTRQGLTKISSDVANDLYYSPQVETFFGSTETGAMSISKTGVTTLVDSPVSRAPLISPRGWEWVWYSEGFNTDPGLWLGPYGGTVTQITDEPVYGATWSPDGVYLFFFAESGFYRIRNVGEELTVIFEGPLDIVDSNAMAWVTP